MQFVTEEKVPPQLFDSCSFLKLTEHIFNGLKINPITSIYDVEKAVLKNKFKNKIPSLKIDIAPLDSKGIFGVNVQCYRNQTIAMVQCIEVIIDY